MSSSRRPASRSKQKIWFCEPGVSVIFINSTVNHVWYLSIVLFSQDLCFIKSGDVENVGTLFFNNKMTDVIEHQTSAGSWSSWL